MVQHQGKLPRLSGIVGWHSWKVLPFRAARRAACPACPERSERVESGLRIAERRGRAIVAGEV